MKIIAIGGGDVGAGDTLSIDRELIGLSSAAHPTVLFIPTASGDSEDYVARFTSTYAAEGCRVEVLRLWSEDGDAETARRRIEQADLIYVGGGNTKRMIALWRELGVDKALRTFVDSGKPVGGLSAGAICWFRVGNSDWPQFEGIPGVNTAPLECLGFVDLVLCPHTRDEEFRLAEFSEMMREIPGVGIGVDDGCAIQIDGDQYRILASQPNSAAHRVYWRDGECVRERLEPHSDFRPIDSLSDPEARAYSLA